MSFDPFASAGNWNEPVTPYGKIKGRKIKSKKGKKSTVYPFNKVYESESGHIIEVDDTPGAERLHQFHRSGTFEEMHPNGDKVDKVVRDRYTSVLRDDYIHIDGNQNLTVDKALKILINADKGRNSPNSNTNFDIEIGDNANINILVNKGNCNVKLRQGDINLLLEAGDVNIRQEAGSYNHFVNGDYNLEVSGHMHTVIGEDHVTEVGGNRDARIDGFFDHTMVTFGYHEISCPLGSVNRICRSRQDIIELNHSIYIGVGRATHIGVPGVGTANPLAGDDMTIYGTYTVVADKVGVIGRIGVGLGTMTDTGIDINAAGIISMCGVTSINAISPIINMTSLVDMNISSGASLRMGAAGFASISSDGAINIASAGPLELLSASTILQTAPMIHLNGPPATPGDPPSFGITGNQLIRLDAPVPPVLPFVYIPGMVGVWRRTVNGMTPLMLVRTSISTLKAQLVVYDTIIAKKDAATSMMAGVMDEVLRGANAAISTVEAWAKPITIQVEKANNAVLDAVEQTEEMIDKAMRVVTDVADATTDLIIGSEEELKRTIQNGLEPAKAGLDKIKGFINDIATHLQELVCHIVKVINDIIGEMIKDVQMALQKVMEGIQKISEAIDKIIAFIKKTIDEIIKKINEIIKTIIDGAGRFIDGIMEGIEGIFSGLGVTEDCGAIFARQTAMVQQLEQLAANYSAPGSEMTEEDFNKFSDIIKAGKGSTTLMGDGTTTFVGPVGGI